MAHSATASLDSVATPSLTKAALPRRQAAASPDQPGSAHACWLLVSIGVVATWVASLLVVARM